MPRFGNILAALGLALFMALAGCDDKAGNQQVELRDYPSSWGWWFRDLFSADDALLIRLHVYDSRTALSRTRVSVHSIDSLEFTVPERALLQSGASGSGDKQILPLAFFSRNGTIELPREGADYDEWKLVTVLLDSISSATLDKYSDNVFSLRTSMRSLASAHGTKGGIACLRNDTECVARLLKSSRFGAQHCGMAILAYDDGSGELREGQNLPYPLSAGNTFVPVSELDKPDSFVACDRNPRGAACLWYSLYKNTYPVSIAVGSEGICEAEKIGQEVFRQLDKATSD